MKWVDSVRDRTSKPLGWKSRPFSKCPFFTPDMNLSSACLLDALWGLKGQSAGITLFLSYRAHGMCVGSHASPTTQITLRKTMKQRVFLFHQSHAALQLIRTPLPFPSSISCFGHRGYGEDYLSKQTSKPGGHCAGRRRRSSLPPPHHHRVIIIPTIFPSSLPPLQ